MKDVSPKFGDGEENEALFIIQGEKYSKDNSDQVYDYNASDYIYSMEVIIKGKSKYTTTDIYVLLTNFLFSLFQNLLKLIYPYR